MNLELKNKKELEEYYHKTDWYINKLAKYLGAMCDTSVEDLRQEGFLGMARARELYNPEISSFLTYAQYWIKTYMYTLAYKNAYMLPIPEEFHLIYSRYARMIKDPAYQTTGDTLQCIADSLEISKNRLEKVVNVVTGLKHGCSLENADNYVNDSAEVLDRVDLESDKMMALLLESTSDEEYFVICHMLGLDGKTPKTLSWVGKILGVTKERIRQIKNTGLEKFKIAYLERGDI